MNNKNNVDKLNQAITLVEVCI